jgi:hypothetical protein
MRLEADHHGIDHNGPTTAEENMKWCSDLVGRCVAFGMKPEWLSDIETVHMTCKWAGLAGMPIGFSFLSEELRRHSDLPDLTLKFHSFTDYDKCCQGNNCN